MHSLRKTAGLLEERLEAWRRLISRGELDYSSDENGRMQHHLFGRRQYLDQIPLDRLLDDELHLSDHQVVRYRFAVDEVLTARGRLLDFLEVIEQGWPNRRSWCEKIKKHSFTSNILGEMPVQSQSLQRELVLGDLSQIRERPFSRQDEDENLLSELDVLYTYRDAKARLAALRELNANSIQDEELDLLAYDALRRSPSVNEMALKWLTTQYIFNEHLFLWTDDGLSEARERRYRIIFDLAKLRDRISADGLRGDLQPAVRRLDGDISKEILGILRRITLFVEIFGYNKFVTDVTQDGGQSGPISGIGSRGPINMFPGGRRSGCEELVIGLAQGRNRTARGSLQNVMRSVRKHMRECIDRTQTALVLTNLWDVDIFADSIDDIELLKRQGNEFIFVLVNGRKLVPMEFPVL